MLLGGPDPDTTTGRRGVGTLIGGTYSLRLRFRECFRAISLAIGLLTSDVSSPDLPIPEYSLDPDLDEDGLSICEESLDSRFTVDPFFDVEDEVRERDCENRLTDFHGELFKEAIGDGKGVMSPIAAS